MKIENVEIPLEDGESVSGVLCAPDSGLSEKAVGAIVAHGAGNDMNEITVVSVCEGLAEAGCASLRFNFSYREKGRKTPDSQKKLENTWEEVLRFFTTSIPYEFKSVIVSGKSMGGRIASQLVAEKRLPADGLILLGYPLHAAGKKDRLRDAHLYDIRIPTLFFAGTRDALCDSNLLEGVLTRMKAPWELMVVEGGDHSFRVPKSADIDQDLVYVDIAKKCREWIESNF